MCLVPIATTPLRISNSNVCVCTSLSTSPLCILSTYSAQVEAFDNVVLIGGMTLGAARRTAPHAENDILVTCRKYVRGFNDWRLCAGLPGDANAPTRIGAPTPDNNSSASSSSFSSSCTWQGDDWWSDTWGCTKPSIQFARADCLCDSRRLEGAQSRAVAATTTRSCRALYAPEHPKQKSACGP